MGQCLSDALARLNPALSAKARISSCATAPHRLLVDGVMVEYRHADSDIRGAQARAIDFDDSAGNDWLEVNQFSVVENKRSGRPDGPLAALELKNAATESATIWSAFQQLQTYQSEVPVLFAPTVVWRACWRF